MGREVGERLRGGEGKEIVRGRRRSGGGGGGGTFTCKGSRREVREREGKRRWIYTRIQH